jgi:hypothetical protein
VSAVQSRAQRSRSKRSSSSHLGSRLRAVLVSPRSGFRSAMRNGNAAAIASSPVTALLVVLGGVATMGLWLKLTSLLKIFDRPISATEWSFVLGGLALGAILAAIAYVAWTRLAPRAIDSDRDASRARLRVAWSFSDFPLALYAAVLLPLDLLIVGPEIFSTDRLDGTFAMVWSALSLALLVALAAWSVYLFVRGVDAAVGSRVQSTVPLIVSAGLAAWIFYIPVLIKGFFD